MRLAKFWILYCGQNGRRWQRNDMLNIIKAKESINSLIICIIYINHRFILNICLLSLPILKLVTASLSNPTFSSGSSLIIFCNNGLFYFFNCIIFSLKYYVSLVFFKIFYRYFNWKSYYFSNCSLLSSSP